jgi:hypothetical protein
MGKRLKSCSPLRAAMLSVYNVPCYKRVIINQCYKPQIASRLCL